MIIQLPSINSIRSEIPTISTLIPICLAVFIAADDQTVIATILPPIMTDLHLGIADIDKASWTITGYLLGYICMMPLVGKLSDVFGHKRLLFITLIVFALGSLLVGLSTNLTFLVASRIFQAIAAGATIPLAISIANNSLPKSKQIIAYGIIAACAEIGSIIGPLWGGIITNFLDWRWVFWLNIPLVFLIIPIVFKNIKTNDKTNENIDYAGAFFITSTLIFLTLFISRLQIMNSITLLCGVVTTLAASGLIFRQLTANTPIIPRFLSSKEFIGSHMIQFLIGIALIIGMVTVPLMANTIFGLSPIHAGFWLLRLTLGVAIGAIAGSILGKLFNNQVIIISGLILSATGYWFLSSWDQNISDPLLTIHLLITGIGLGSLIGPITQLATNTPSGKHHGIAASLINTTKFLGMTLGLSSISVWGAYRFQQLNADFTLSILTANNPAAFNQIVTNGITVLTEFFLIAMAVCLFAIIPSLLISRNGL